MIDRRIFRRPFLSLGLGLVLLAVALQGCDGDSPRPEEAPSPRPERTLAPEVEALVTESPIGQPGGRLLVDLRAEPTSFNPVTGHDNPTRTVLRRMMADLVHIDRATQQTVPALATAWTVSEDGLRYVLDLRQGIRFSDGEPFDADDVIFTFQVYLDEEVGSPNREALIVAGEPITVRKLDSHRVEVELAAPYAVGERLFDSIAILPRHRLEQAYAEGRFAETWDLSTPPDEVVGLGPFRLRRYLPGQRIELEPNPHYWKVDREQRPLPYLDELVFHFTPSQETQVLRFQNGDSHLIHRLTAKGYAVLEQNSSQRPYVLQDLGPELRYEFLFFNLNHLDDRLPQVRRKQSWFRRKAFRQALSWVIDRESMVRLTFQGRAMAISGPIPPTNRLWHNPKVPAPVRDLDRARQLLREEGFRWSAEGTLQDPEGHPVSLTLLTNASNRQRVELAAILQADFEEIGLELRVVSLEFGTLVERVTKTLDYEVCLLGLRSEFDPNGHINFLTSSGGNHLWHPSQKTPSTPWEAEIDRLMSQQLTELDPAKRKVLFDQVQEILYDESPALFLVSPNILVGAHQNLGNFRPTILDHSTLWNAEELYWRPEDEG